MILHETPRPVVKFMEGLHTGDFGSMLFDLNKYSNFLGLTDVERLQLKRFEMGVAIEQYKAQTAQLQTAPQAAPTADDHRDHEDKSEGQPLIQFDNQPRPETDEEKAKAKEDAITAERKRHAIKCIDEAVTFHVQPSGGREHMKAVWTSSFC